MKKRILLCLYVLFSMAANAEVVLPKMFSDGMVLQRETQANLWGEARKNSTVKITTSWNQKTYTAKTDHDGRWKQAVTTPEAGGPYGLESKNLYGEN